MIYVNSVNVLPSSVTIKVGDWYYGASATVCPTDASCKSVRWHSDNTSVATVSTTTGYIYANASGTAKIYATAIDGSSKSGYITVTVKDIINVNSVELNRASVSLEVGTCCALTATVCPENATNTVLNWRSNNPSVAKVSDGVVCALTKGSAIITAIATDGSGACDCCTVTVTGDILVTSVTVSPATQTMLVGESMYLRGTVLPANATNKCVGWISNDTNVATVNQDSGLVYAQNPGTAVIYATACDGSEARGGAIIKVEAPVLAESITVLPEKITISPDETVSLSASISPSNVTNKNVIWRSSNTRIATVKDGIVTGLKGGTVTITAKTADGNASDTCEITIDPRPKVIIKGEAKINSYPDGQQINDGYSAIFFPKTSTENAAEWRIIGCDMSLPENISDKNLTFELEEAYQHERNYIHNHERTYSPSQLAFAYLLDPLGVEYFMKNYESTKMEGSSFEERTRNLLNFKDDVYEAIFGVRPGKFIQNDKGEKIITELESDRIKYFTDAEVLFGNHTIKTDFGEVVLKTVFDLVISIFESKSEVFSVFMSALDMIKVMFYSSSITDSIKDNSADVATLFAEDYIKMAIGNEQKRRAALNMLGVIGIAINAITSFADNLVDQIENPDLSTQQILPKINNQNDYRACIIVDGEEKTVDDVIKYCSDIFSRNN